MYIASMSGFSNHLSLTRTLQFRDHHTTYTQTFCVSFCIKNLTPALALIWSITFAPSKPFTPLMLEEVSPTTLLPLLSVDRDWVRADAGDVWAKIGSGARGAGVVTCLPSQGFASRMIIPAETK